MNQEQITIIDCSTLSFNANKVVVDLAGDLFIAFLTDDVVNLQLYKS